MKNLILLFFAAYITFGCVPAKWWHSGQRCSGFYVRDTSWKGGGYMTWERCDENGVRYWDYIPVSMAEDIEFLTVSNGVSQ